MTLSAAGSAEMPSSVDNLNILDYEYYGRLVEAFLTADVPAALLIYKEIRGYRTQPPLSCTAFTVGGAEQLAQLYQCKLDKELFVGSHAIVQVGIIALSLKSSANRNDGGEESMTDNKPRRSSAFTDEQLKAAWGAIIEAHPKEHLLINAMRLAVPVRVEATRFGVNVET